MARCGSCCKFVNLEEETPEVESLEINEDEISYEVRIIRVCAECGDELKEAYICGTAEFSGDRVHLEEGHELSIDEDTIEALERHEGEGKKIKNFYGFELVAKITCTCEKPIDSITIHDDIEACDLEEMC